MSERPHGIGGSDAAAAIGLSPYESPVGLWLRLTGRTAPREETEAMRLETRLQPLLAELTHEAGYQVIPAPADTLVGPEPFMFGHVDGYCAGKDLSSGERHGDAVKDGSGELLAMAPPTGSSSDSLAGLSERGVLELKTAGLFQAKHWEADEIPLHYQAQGLHYMAVTGLPFCVFGVLIGGQRFQVRRLERDDAAVENLIAAERDFWQYVERDEQPPVEWATGSDLAALFPDSTEATVALDDDPLLVERLLRTRQMVKVAEAENVEAENAVKARLGEAGTATLAGAKVATWRTQTAKRVDVKRLPPDVRAEFEYETSSRVFRVFA